MKCNMKCEQLEQYFCCRKAAHTTAILVYLFSRLTRHMFRLKPSSAFYRGCRQDILCKAILVKIKTTIEEDIGYSMFKEKKTLYGLK